MYKQKKNTIRSKTNNLIKKSEVIVGWLKPKELVEVADDVGVGENLLPDTVGALNMFVWPKEK